MDSRQRTVARACLDGSYNGTMSFPEGLQALTEAGFESYQVDYRLNTRTYYLPNGETLVLTLPHDHGAISPRFNQPELAALIKWAQLNPPNYSYVEFNRRVAANGCAGYVVSILGRRVLYFGRTAETHVEHFPL